MYALFFGHLVLPAFGVPFDSATIVSTFAEFPEWFKLSTKALIAFPAAFHTREPIPARSEPRGGALTPSGSQRHASLELGRGQACVYIPLLL